MPSDKEQVLIEKFELDVKIEKLTIFGNGRIFPTLPETERDRLMRQVLHMQEYSNILRERILAFQQ